MTTTKPDAVSVLREALQKLIDTPHCYGSGQEYWAECKRKEDYARAEKAMRDTADIEPVAATQPTHPRRNHSRRRPTDLHVYASCSYPTGGRCSGIQSGPVGVPSQPTFISKSARWLDYKRSVERSRGLQASPAAGTIGRGIPDSSDEHIIVDGPLPRLRQGMEIVEFNLTEVTTAL